MFLRYPYKLVFKTERLMVLFCLRIYRRTFAWKLAKKFSRPFRLRWLARSGSPRCLESGQEILPPLQGGLFLWVADRRFPFSSRRYEVAPLLIANHWNCLWYVTE